jgi:MFS family permease
LAQSAGIRLYRYRWVVLGAFALLNAVVQANWITFAPVTDDAAAFYGVSDLRIGLLSMIFMVVFVVVSIPASYVIDTYGLRVGVGIGALLTGVFALTRGLFGDDYGWVFASQVGLAVGQPFVMNAITKVGARWFPLGERATAAAVPSLAQFVGIIAAMAATPSLVEAFGMRGMLVFYGVLSAGGGVVALALIRERPPTPPDEAGLEPRTLVFAGLRRILRQRDMLILLALFFVGLGIFNAITTWIEQVVAPRGFDSEEAGIIGAAMVVGGILGAAVLSVLSDRLRRRKPFLVLAVAGMAPGLVGLAFATAYPLLLASAFVFGFFLMSAYPVGFQYSAEVSYPAPEATSQGLMIMAGQVSGILFILAMDAFRSGPDATMTGSMVAFIALTAVIIALASFLRESPMIRGADRSLPPEADDVEAQDDGRA